MKHVITFIIIILVIVGGWTFFNQGSNTPISAVPSEKASIIVQATLSPTQPIAGEPTTITLSFINTDGTAVTDLMTHHARLVHVVIAGENLRSLGHIHPQDFSTLTDEMIASGTYSVTYTFPEAGKYIAGVDVMNSKETVGKQFIVNVNGTPKMSTSVTEDSRTMKCFKGYKEDGGTDRYVQPILINEAETTCPDGYTVTFSPSVTTITAGEEVRLSYHVEKDGMPVTNLAPFLNAPLHLAIVPASLSTLLHRHGTVSGAEDHHHDATDESMSMSDDDMHMEETSMDLTGIHIMPDGSVMLANGDTLHDATVTMDGMIKLANGKMVTPAMDMRSTAESMSMDMATMHHEDAPASFGPDLVSEGITFPEAGIYQIFAQTKHGDEIIYTDFMVRVEKSFKEADANIFGLGLQNRKLSTEILTLNEGDQAIIRVSTDEEGKFHIAGYEIEKSIHVGKVTEIRFTADKAGRYNLELHPEGTSEDVVIGALVVNPK